MDPVSENKNQNKEWLSWNECIKHKYSTLIQVVNEEELQQTIKNNKSIRVFGSKLSSSDINGGTLALIDMSAYHKIVSVNRKVKEITVQAGATLEHVLNVVQASGWCIPCLPDSNKLTVGGALATGTHGSMGYILSKYVSKFRMVLADGSIREFTDQDIETDAVRVSLGLLGVFSEITFKCEDNYQLHVKEEPVRDTTWLTQLDDYVMNHDFVRIIWLPKNKRSNVVLGTKIHKDVSIDKKQSKGALDLLNKSSKFTRNCNGLLQSLLSVSKRKYKGSLYDTTVHKTEVVKEELVEWTVAYSRFKDLFLELKTNSEDKENKFLLNFAMDIRFLKKDNTWLSTASNEDVVSIEYMLKKESNADEILTYSTIEDLFLKYGGKPHWGKKSNISAQQLIKLYPKFEAFQKLRNKLDPTDKFLNPYLTKIFSK